MNLFASIPDQMPEASQPVARCRSEERAQTPRHGVPAHRTPEGCKRHNARPHWVQALGVIRPLRSALLIASILACSSCSKPASQAVPAPADASSTSVADLIKSTAPFASPKQPKWPSSAFAKVIGYRFHGRDEFSLIHGGQIATELQSVVVRGQALDGSQVDRLLSAAFTSESVDTGAPCYSPHHIFVFYDATDKPMAAIEACFSCDQISETPDNPAVRDTKHHDFVALAKLAWDLGLWDGTKADVDRYCESTLARRNIR